MVFKCYYTTLVQIQSKGLDFQRKLKIIIGQKCRTSQDGFIEKTEVWGEVEKACHTGWEPLEQDLPTALHPTITAHWDTSNLCGFSLSLSSLDECRLFFVSGVPVASPFSGFSTIYSAGNHILYVPSWNMLFIKVLI